MKGVQYFLTGTEGNSMFCGHETDNISQGEAKGSIGSRGCTKQTVSQKSISIL